MKGIRVTGGGLLATFWGLVDDSDGPDACWPWQGTIDDKGYGRLGLGRGAGVYSTYTRAHRFAYELLVGPIPDGLVLDHVCHDEVAHKCTEEDACLHRRCVNPAHLRPSTHKENLNRGYSAAERAAKRTHCPHGHAYSGDNLRVTPQGHRKCRACERESSRRRYRNTRA